MCVGSHDELRLMLRETAARTEGVSAAHLAPAGRALSGALEWLKTWIAAFPAISEAKR